MRHFKTALALTLLFIPALTAHKKNKPSPYTLYQGSEYIMGTRFQIKIYDRSESHAQQAMEKAFATLRHHDHVLSDYQENSELNLALSRLKRSSQPSKVRVSPLLYKALKTSHDYMALSQGLFDIRTGSLMRLWGFKSRDYRVPSAQEIAVVLKQMKASPLQLSKSGPSFSLAHPHLSIDFGAIGKGMAIDAAVQDLKAFKITAGVIDSHSTQYFIGSPPGQKGWSIAIPAPQNQSHILKWLTLKDQAISTSGTDQQAFEYKNQRYGHILNPLTGYPVNQVLQTTVVAPTATASDALSTLSFLTESQALSNLLTQRPKTQIWRVMTQTPQKLTALTSHI